MNVFRREKYRIVTEPCGTRLFYVWLEKRIMWFGYGHIELEIWDKDDVTPERMAKVLRNGTFKGVSDKYTSVRNEKNKFTLGSLDVQE